MEKKLKTSQKISLLSTEGKELTQLSTYNVKFANKPANRAVYYNEQINNKNQDFSLEKCFTPEPEIAKKIMQNYRAEESKNKADENRKYELFNGNVLVSFLEKLSNGSYKFKLVPCTYADYLAASKEIIDPIRPGGTVCLLLTADIPAKIIIGSRDVARSIQDITMYPLQFPCGFHDSNKHQLKELEICQNIKSSIDDFAAEEGLRELKEELLKFENNEKIKPIGSLGYNAFKINEQEMITEYFELYQTNLSLQEIEQKRNIRKPKDWQELTKVGGIGIQEIVDVLNNGCEIYFDGKNRKFAGNLSSGISLMYHAMIRRSLNLSIENQRLLLNLKDCKKSKDEQCGFSN